jgi:hypothetical protein
MAKVVVRSVDMDPEMLEFAHQTILSNLERLNTEKEIAIEMKKAFETKY